ncbi:receptor-like protein 2 [Corylus avellana]|uniref:receptor-like protein 2 n=1 Tax=Corylus avellana TaxID=13451 RepID=UPI00286A43BA|nr:receptor-like protein 2 [Corylus avellana]
MPYLKPFHLLFTLFLFRIFSTNHACNQIDHDSLLSLAFNCMSSPLLNWSSIDCCKWEGISCDHKRQVTHIWLPSKGLSGSISPSLGNLTHLSHLNLSHNSLSGPLPQGLFLYLSQLKVLDLSYNNLFGDTSGWPSSIQIVDISSNQFTETIQSSFLQRAWRLTDLNVSNNSLTGPIPSFPCINSSLVRLLDFSHNHHSGHIPSGLGACSKLKVFRAGFNSLSGFLPHDIYNAMELEEISLPSNDLFGPISGGIVNLSKLTYLELYRNKLSGKLPVDIGKLSKLKHLLLNGNSLNGSLPLSLANCTNLIKLILRSNCLEGNISTFNFSSLHQLTVIDLMANNFSGNFPVSLYSCKSLTAIRLALNQLEGQIQPEVLQLKFLSFLSLCSNRLTNITYAIKILMRCKALSVLFLGQNFLHEAMPSDDNIVDSDGFENLRMFSLTECQLTDNNLHGPIPLGTQLQSFDASAYEGNPGLCGPPLPHDCDHIVSNKEDIQDEDDGPKIPWFPINVVLGFITGFWGVCGSLFLNYKWRVAYFQFMDNLKDSLNTPASSSSLSCFSKFEQISSSNSRPSAL